MFINYVMLKSFIYLYPKYIFHFQNLISQIFSLWKKSQDRQYCLWCIYFLFDKRKFQKSRFIDLLMCLLLYEKISFQCSFVEVNIISLRIFFFSRKIKFQNQTGGLIYNVCIMLNWTLTLCPYLWQHYF